MRTFHSATEHSTPSDAIGFRSPQLLAARFEDDWGKRKQMAKLITPKHNGIQNDSETRIEMINGVLRHHLERFR